MPRRGPRGPLILAAAIMLVAWVTTQQAAPVAFAKTQGVALQRVLAAETFARPLYITPVPDGSGDLVVVEQAGLVKRFNPRAALTATKFLDLRGSVSRDGNEEGLLSIAFHPEYGHNGRLFVYYSAAGPRRSLVVEFAATGATASLRVPDPATAREILAVPQPYANHNGGLLLFGPDGMLYIALGDGGAGGDPLGHGQNRSTLLGSLLRIDVNGQDPGLAYAIPADNPFVGAGDGSRAEIWAYGLRNPWRYSFDRVTGALWLADVGQERIEEVNRVVKGGNYGWNRMEGRSCFKPPANCNTSGLVPPLSEYDHSQGHSITGGYVYRGAALPALQGRYVFADFAVGTLWSIPADTTVFVRPQPLLTSDALVSSFGQDEDGELYVTDLRGRIYRLVPQP